MQSHCSIPTLKKCDFFFFLRACMLLCSISSKCEQLSSQLCMKVRSSVFQCNEIQLRPLQRNTPRIVIKLRGGEKKKRNKSLHIIWYFKVKESIKFLQGFGYLHGLPWGAGGTKQKPNPIPQTQEHSRNRGFRIK